MGELSLVPDTLARPGYRFTFLGANDGPECDGCPVRSLCFRIRPGRRYEVETVRDVRHPCNLHEGGKVRVVTVREVPLRTSLETERLRGTAATWRPVPCGYPECAKYALCHPIGAPAEAKYEVAEDKGPMACPMHYDLHEVVLKRIE